MLKTRIVIALTVLGIGLPAASFAQSGPALSERSESKGILLLAHGGSAEWNAQVTKLASEVDRTSPTEVAFGMATRANIQSAVDRLQARGATEIVAVPLFVSSWSSVITSTEYLLGQRADAPPELAVFAKMSHGGHGASAPPAAHHGGEHTAHTASDPQSPVKSAVPIRMTRALNDNPVVADILTSRARSISQNASNEAIVIVAHGPVGDDENRRWLDDMRSIAGRIANAGQFASIDYLTLRDDAPKPTRDAATAELRALVTKRIGEGRRVLILPLLVSFGGIERGLRERLDGLAYTMPATALVPDERLVSWVLAMASGGS